MRIGIIHLLILYLPILPTGDTVTAITLVGDVPNCFLSRHVTVVTSFPAPES
jgi:hypothetical protein